MHRISLSVIITATLFGCVVTPPPTGMDKGPDTTDPARRACMAEAKRQGLQVRAIERTVSLGGDRSQLVMRTRGQYGPERISCVYNDRYGIARIEGQPEPEKDQFVLARQACIDEARRQGWNVTGVDRTIDLGGLRYQVKLQARGPSGPVPVTCIYNAQFRAARIQ